LHRLAHASLKGFQRTPTQFTLDLACVDCVAGVVAGAVFDERVQIAVAGDFFLFLIRRKFFQQVADSV